MTAGITLRHGYRRGELSLLIWFGFTLFLSACGMEHTVNADLYADDSILQTLQRFFFPADYWEEKKRTLQDKVKQSKAAFQERTQAYHALLQKRRANVMQAIAQAEATGSDPRVARRKAIQALRANVDPLREEARQHGKALRRAMALLVRVEAAAGQQER